MCLEILSAHTDDNMKKVKTCRLSWSRNNVNNSDMQMHPPEIRGLGFRDLLVSHIGTSAVSVTSDRELPSIDIAPCDVNFSRRPVLFSNDLTIP